MAGLRKRPRRRYTRPAARYVIEPTGTFDYAGRPEYTWVARAGNNYEMGRGPAYGTPYAARLAVRRMREIKVVRISVKRAPDRDVT